MAKYRDISRIGIGGFGEVWRCKRLDDSEKFAKKRLNAEADDDAKNRFVGEVKILKKLKHKNIVPIIASNLAIDRPFFIMPLYVKSMESDLDNIIGDEERTNRVFSDILDGIEYAHSQNVIHRDLKPANVLLDTNGNAVVSDFGLGRRLDSATTRNTITGFGMGTVLYMAPEQLSNAKVADCRSDIYSLGRMLYELHTASLDSLAQDTSRLPAGIGMIVDRCTLSDPNRRYQNIDDLKRIWHEVTDTSSASASERLTTLIGGLPQGRSASVSLLDGVVELISQFRDDKEFVHECVMKLPAWVIGDLSKHSVRFTRQLISSFVDHVVGQGWDYGYTDKIGRVCKGIFDKVSDYHIKAEVIFCTFEVGQSHTRWYVLGIFDEMFGEPLEAAVSIALAERVASASPSIRSAMRQRLPASRLHARLRQALEGDSP